MPDVYTFCGLATDEWAEIEIYDLNTSQTVFAGSFRDAMYSEWADYDVWSFDLDNGKIILNIDTEA